MTQPLETNREFTSEELLLIHKEVGLHTFCENIKTNDGYYQIDYSVNLVEKKRKKSFKMIDVIFNGTFEEYLRDKGLKIINGKRFIQIAKL